MQVLSTLRSLVRVLRHVTLYDFLLCCVAISLPVLVVASLINEGEGAYYTQLVYLGVAVLMYLMVKRLNRRSPDEVKTRRLP